MKTFRAIAFIWFGGLTSTALFFDRQTSACVFVLLMICVQLDHISDILKEKAANSIKEQP